MTGFFLGSMFHPFGWGFAGPYYGGGPLSGGGWGGPGYSPAWSWVGLAVDILGLLLIALLLWAIIRAIVRSGRRRRSAYYEPYYDPGDEPMYDNEYETVETTQTTTYERTPAQLDEQAVYDACCEYVAHVRGCAPQDVTVDLLYHEQDGFGADIWVTGTSLPSLSEQQLVEAVKDFVASREQVAAARVHVTLQFHHGQGIHASADIT